MKVKRTPTQLITGFLGVGKTTAILHLLKHKPAQERWAVLVNEFGEIGIDGAILESSGSAVKEVAGGCICCVAGLPLQVGINQLLGSVKPDRLLIEPSGLGHPQNILDLLAGPHFLQVLELRATVCLVDARKAALPRYVEHALFRDQLALADVVVANKSDLCTQSEREQLEALLASFDPPQALQASVEQGAMPQALLDAPRRHAPRHFDPAHTHSGHAVDLLPAQLPEGQAFVRRENAGLGYHSCGWLLAARLQFDFGRLFALCSALNVDRLKAVINTERGVFVFNAEEGVLSVRDAGVTGSSRIEVIHHSALPWQRLEQSLFSALIEPLGSEA